jgi:hypothetical protein
MNPRRYLTGGSVMLLGIIAGWSGCYHAPAGMGDVGPVRLVNNHGGMRTWPAEIRRVAVLPVHAREPLIRDPAHLGLFDSEWLGALQTTQRAEFVALDRETLRRWTDGQTSLDSASALPHDLLTRLRKQTAAEAVVMVDVMQVRLAPPQAMGLRIKFVRLDDGLILWAADEWFDLADGATARDLRWSARAHHHGPGNPTYAPSQSPSLFFKHCADMVLRKLPLRRHEGSGNA